MEHYLPYRLLLRVSQRPRQLQHLPRQSQPPRRRRLRERLRVAVGDKCGSTCLPRCITVRARGGTERPSGENLCLREKPRLKVLSPITARLAVNLVLAALDQAARLTTIHSTHLRVFCNLVWLNRSPSPTPVELMNMSEYSKPR